jgi:dimethylhistidine N-methyltransferase
MIARELVALPAFATDVETGLTVFPKSLPAKLFYDRRGSELFEEITRLPEYYLTRTELQILRDRAGEMIAAAGESAAIVELGSGTATKTCTLLQALSRRQMRVRYFPVDISSSALAEARERVMGELERVLVRPVVADFSHGFHFLRDIPGKKLVLYLGSSIGNFDPDAAIGMLSGIREELTPGDALLLGTDMVKSASLLVPAYNDAQGVTANFNKNMLARLNRELGADFDLDSFRHVAHWNDRRSRMEIYLESARTQAVDVALLRMKVHFVAGERIHTENSYKYTMGMVEGMLHDAGFVFERSWFDRRKWFGLHLARV